MCPPRSSRTASLTCRVRNHIGSRTIALRLFSFGAEYNCTVSLVLVEKELAYLIQTQVISRIARRESDSSGTLGRRHRMLDSWWQIASLALVSGVFAGFAIDRLLTRQPRRIWFKGTFEFENH